ncbi:hypothetical protein B0J11DRAFT_126979 [Dendryphion nanum]|uniref:Uncharacterized protein n=1 Tax=Dendryphion nanum TaxID=256645 RepID=A0A9P9D9M8_9PLEO|nr:hypothetical protein B0J11DRAFT_126979 [Dendryphion nanum]
MPSLFLSLTLSLTHTPPLSFSPISHQCTRTITSTVPPPCIDNDSTTPSQRLTSHSERANRTVFAKRSDTASRIKGVPLACALKAYIACGLIASSGSFPPPSHIALALVSMRATHIIL